MELKIKYYTLSQISGIIQSSLLENFGSGIWLIAEISKITPRKHYYLELIEKDQLNNTLASMQAVIWASRASRILRRFETITGMQLKAGQKLLMFGRVEYHPVYGLKFQIEDIDPSYTVGEAALNRQRTIAELKKAGVFDQNRTLALPGVIQRIAVISSETAAGLEDFVKQLIYNPYGFKFYLELFPAIMQGENTPSSIIAALNRIKKRKNEFDVVVIVRGGGSSTDLTAYDSEVLAKEVATFPLPVMTGIGHTRDQSIVDMVANTPLKTPTAVADYILKRTHAFYTSLVDLKNRLDRGTIAFLNAKKMELRETETQLRKNVSDFLWQNKYSLQNLSARFRQIPQLLKKRNIDLHLTRQRLAAASRQFIRDRQRGLDTLKQDLARATEKFLTREKTYLERLKTVIDNNDVKKILEKGFSITVADGRAITDASDLQPGQTVETILANGGFVSQVNTVFTEQNSNNENSGQ